MHDPRFRPVSGLVGVLANPLLRRGYRSAAAAVVLAVIVLAAWGTGAALMLTPGTWVAPRLLGAVLLTMARFGAWALLVLTPITVCSSIVERALLQDRTDRDRSVHCSQQPISAARGNPRGRDA